MRYDFRCPDGHVIEVTCAMADVPPTVDCLICELAGKQVASERVYAAPTIHFRGPGFYATDVKGTLHRSRRKSAADGLPKEFDRDTARVADRI